MRYPAPNTVIVRPEQIRLVRRDNSKKWQAHYKIDGVKKWFRKSLETTDQDKAVQLAERLWMKATFDHEEGRPVISKRFKPVAEVVQRRLEEEIKHGTNTLALNLSRPKNRNVTSPPRLLHPARRKSPCW